MIENFGRSGGHAGTFSDGGHIGGFDRAKGYNNHIISNNNLYRFNNLYRYKNLYRYPYYGNYPSLYNAYPINYSIDENALLKCFCKDNNDFCLKNGECGSCQYKFKCSNCNDSYNYICN